QLKLDIEELNNLLLKTSRQRSKDVLNLEIKKLQTELIKLTEENKTLEPKPTSSISNSPQKFYEVKLYNYGWDQSGTMIKLYVTLKNVHQLPKEAVSCKFTEKSLDLHVVGLDNKNYNLAINNLCEDIDPDNSTVKIKTDTLVVSLAKKIAKHWSHVTGVEKRIKELKKSAMAGTGEDDNLGSNFMSLMQKMYQEGDDELKQKIAKIWAEGHEKKSSRL
ncbi:Calcyclin-binding protein, partial [Eufriesea mexicana]